MGTCTVRHRNLYLLFPQFALSVFANQKQNQNHEISETNPELEEYEEYFSLSDHELDKEDDDFDSINVDDSNNIDNENHSLSNHDLNIIESLPLE